MSKKGIILTIVILAAAIFASWLILWMQDRGLMSTADDTRPLTAATASPTPVPTEQPYSSPTAEIVYTPDPAAVIPTPEPTATAAESIYTPEPTPEVTSGSLTPSATSGPGEAQPMGYGFPMDLDGDGLTEDIVFDPANLSANGTIQLMINGVMFDTYIPQGAGGCGLFYGDVDTSDGQTELFLQVVQEYDSDLYVYRYEYGTLVRSTFTYTLPAYLSESGMSETLYDVDYVTFYGVHPILVMGDGSFGLLYGDAFTMFYLDGNAHFTEMGTQPADIISGEETIL